MRGNGNVHLTDFWLQTFPWRNDIYLITKTAYIITWLSWQLNSMGFPWLATVKDGLIVHEQLFPKWPLFSSMMMGTGVVLERLVNSPFNHLMQLLAQKSFMEKTTYFNEIQRCILSYSRCILLDPTLCHFNTIHYSQLMYLKPVLLLFYDLLVSFPYGNLLSYSPVKFCTTSQCYPSNTFHPSSHLVKVPTSCYASLASSCIFLCTSKSTTQ